MDKKLLLALGGVALGLAWWQKGALENMAGVIGVNDYTLGLPNVQAMLKTIRVGEGTSDALGYYRLVGNKSGAQFTDMSDHPRIIVDLGSIKSSAAGAYQFLIGTWDWLANKYDLPDFSPHSQDLGALGLFVRRGALQDVVDGNLAAAISKLNKEWASLPGSPYGQHTLTLAQEEVSFAKFGGRKNLSMGDVVAHYTAQGGSVA